jgi:hypothetical protein
MPRGRGHGGGGRLRIQQEGPRGTRGLRRGLPGAAPPGERRPPSWPGEAATPGPRLDRSEGGGGGVVLKVGEAQGVSPGLPLCAAVSVADLFWWLEDCFEAGASRQRSTYRWAPGH